MAHRTVSVHPKKSSERLIAPLGRCLLIVVSHLFQDVAEPVITIVTLVQPSEWYKRYLLQKISGTKDTYYFFSSPAENAKMHSTSLHGSVNHYVFISEKQPSFSARAHNFSKMAQLCYA